MNYPNYYESFRGHRDHLMHEVASERLAGRLRVARHAATPRANRGIRDRLGLNGQVASAVSRLLSGADPVKTKA